MATQQGILAGKAVVSIGADDSEFQRAIRKTSARLQALGNGIAGIGTRIAGIGLGISAALDATAIHFANTGHELLLMSQRTGISVETLSALKGIAGQTGIEFGAMAAGVRAMQRQIGSAIGGSQAAEQTFANLGITLEQLRGADTETQLRLVTEGLRNVANPTEQAAAAMRVLGRNGTEWIPAINRDIGGLIDEARAMGRVLSEEDAQAADKLWFALKSMASSIKRISLEIGAAAAPALKAFAEKITAVARTVGAFIKVNRGLVVMVGSAAAGLIVGGLAIVVFGKGIMFAGVALKFVLIPLKLAIGLFGVLLSPIGIVTAAIVAAGAAFLYFSGVGGAAIRALGSFFRGAAGDARTAINGIVDALSSGDTEGAARIMWLGLRAIWLQGIVSLNFSGLAAGFYSVADDIVDYWTGTVNRIATIMAHINVRSGLRGAARTLLPGGGFVASLIDPDSTVTALDEDIAGEAERTRRARARRDRGMGDGSVERDLETARRELNEAVAGVASRRASGSSSSLPTPAQIQAQVSSRANVSGTFNAAAAAGLGVGRSLGERQLEEARRQTALLQEIAGNEGGAFGP